MQHFKTIHDLKILKEIDAKIMKLSKEARDLKKSCEHQDFESKLIETLAFEYTPRNVCVVCGHTRSDLTVEEKFLCIKEFFAEFEDDGVPYHSDKVLRVMAEDGGFNL